MPPQLALPPGAAELHQRQQAIEQLRITLFASALGHLAAVDFAHGIAGLPEDWQTNGQEVPLQLHADKVAAAANMYAIQGLATLGLIEVREVRAAEANGRG